MYENYIFDLYGTLVDIRTNESKAYLWQKMSEIYTALGAAYSAAELKNTFRVLEKKENALLFEYGEIDLRKVFAALFAQKGIAADEQTVRAAAVTFRALSRKMLCLYDGVLETLQELRNRGRGVYLLSNAQSDFTRPELEMLGLTPYFDGILISSEEGVKKPAKQFFDCLFERFQLEPSGCLMVGNDEYSDIAGAISAGIDSLYIHTAISPDIIGESKATYVVMTGDWKTAADIILS